MHGSCRPAREADRPRPEPGRLAAVSCVVYWALAVGESRSGATRRGGGRGKGRTKPSAAAIWGHDVGSCRPECRPRSAGRASYHEPKRAIGRSKSTRRLGHVAASSVRSGQLDRRSELGPSAASFCLLGRVLIDQRPDGVLDYLAVRARPGAFVRGLSTARPRSLAGEVVLAEFDLRRSPPAGREAVLNPRLIVPRAPIWSTVNRPVRCRRRRCLSMC